MVRKYKSAFDIIGPIMVGPSSSHTAGAVRIGRIARQLFGTLPQHATIEFLGSFAETYLGHGTALAVVAGLLGLATDNPKIKESFQLAEETGMKIEFLTNQKETEFANTCSLILKTDIKQLCLTAASIGGGTIQLLSINGICLGDSNQNSLIYQVAADYKVTSMKEREYIMKYEPTLLLKDSIEAIYLVEWNISISQELLEEMTDSEGIINVFTTINPCTSGVIE